VRRHLCLDEILGSPTDLPIAEHTVDTAGQTLAVFAVFAVFTVFAVFDLIGLRFLPASETCPPAASTA